ncbi:MFS transporter [Marisediminicola antarctica]|uniref:MFS transporter n=1 Tax=Marisediminicola antarctica TaxID=674079 RepID=A0A7L5AIA1_9MICO|nr:MFS transporter [Marisediminicola antarctica]QHO69505.1 MFS transporter [Marisediminicola antarctica]
MTTAAPPFDWRKMALPVYLPTLLFAIGEGAIIPIIPIVADGLGATLAIAGLIAAMIMLGHLIGDIPSGWLVSRIGERPAMIGAALVAIVGLGIATLSPNPVVLGLGILIVGIATAVFALARHAFMTTFVPQPYRARALSTLGGTFRLGYFIGPFLAAGVIALTGSTSAVFLIHIVGCVGAAAVLLLLRDPAATFGAGRAAHHAPTPGEAFVAEEVRGLFRTIWESRQILTRLGTGAALIGALRASRAVILPLWAVSIGISDTRTAIIIGIAGGIDFALFYVSGQVMDRFGRLWAAVPSMVGLGAGHLVLAGSGALPGNVVWFIAVAMFLALANGLGSGILMTLGADLADKRNPAPFLGAWRFTGDIGGAAASLVIAAATAAFSLAVASSVMGVLGLLGAGVLLRYVPRFVPRERR